MLSYVFLAPVVFGLWAPQPALAGPGAAQLPVAGARQTEWNVTLTPVTSGHDDSALSSLIVEETINGRTFGDGEDILSIPYLFAGIDMSHMTDAGLCIKDDEGVVELTRRHGQAGPVVTNVWKSKRSTIGVVKVTYTALPRPVSSATRAGPALDFREDHGGLVGSGMGFLAIPQDEPDVEVYLTLRWNLSSAPTGTSAAWSFGDGAGPFLTSGTNMFSHLQSTYFATGPIEYLVSPSDSPDIKTFNVYWFGKPPFDPFPLGTRLKTLFEHMRLFFRDVGNTYRVFLRHNPFPGSLTGTALARSFLFGYDDSEFSFPPSLQDRESVLAHEMVHNWVLMEKDAVRDNWYHEGLAEYYQVLLRYRFGLLSAREYLDQVNAKLTGYYTAPLRNWHLDEVQKVTWNTSFAQRVPYVRGFTFGLLINGLIKGATDGQHGLDDLVKILGDKKQAGTPVGVDDYLELLAGYLRNKTRAEQLVESMRAGELIIPLSTSLEALPLSTQLVREDREKFELGFDEASLMEGDHVVRGLVRGSRAERVGIRNGDRVEKTFGSAYNKAKEHFDAKLVLKVERTGSEPFTVEYWPRSFEKMEAYHYKDELVDL